MKRIAFSLALLAGLSGCQKKDTLIFNAVELQGKTRMQIREVVGQPDSTYKKNLLVKLVDVDFYEDNSTEFRYQNGSLDEIVIDEPYAYDFDPRLIEMFGFEFRQPDQNDPDAIYSWEKIDGIERFSMYIVRSKKPDSIDRKFNIFIDY